MTELTQSTVLETDMAAVDRLIRTKLHSDVALVQQVSEYIIYAGGKRLRPRLVLLWMRALKPAASAAEMQAAYSLAAIVEFIHTATLLHDDVVDESVLRRSRPTANEVFGNATSVLVGDFIYSRSFQMMVEHSLAVIKVLADTTNVIAEGEVLQLLHKGEANQADYLRVIERKTAQLFEAASVLGAMAVNSSDTQLVAARRYGHGLGMAFQIMDDVLDYVGSVNEMGKNVGDDLKEGKYTLPLIYFLEGAAPAVRAEVEQVVALALEGQAKADAVSRIVNLVKASPALARAEQLAQEYAQSAADAVATLPANPCTAVLTQLCREAVSRRT